MAADLIEILAPYLRQLQPTPSLERQEIILKLADAFQRPPKEVFNPRTEDYIFVSTLSLSPEELAKHTGIGNYDLWRDFLSLTPVQNYIKKRMGEEADIAARKGMEALAAQANKGDVSAIRHLNDLSGYLNKEANNKVIILHYIKRPTPKEAE